MENYTADKAVIKPEDDKFQRYNFSKRIAETIINRKSKESIVIGLYGAWGEGKTTVINFIKNEITPHYPKVIQFTFNPWRFTDEAALLTSYFNTLAIELKKSLEKETTYEHIGISQTTRPKKKSWWKRKKGELKTNTETLGEIITEYGKIVSIFGAGEAAEAIGKAISNISIDTLKERIETLLEKHKRKIVIFIDDIDRLDKNEIHSIFRLVKLTGDFSYTTYILSFDRSMVAAAIGDRFGTGDKLAGESFLEKIIQVPLTLPVAQKEALKNYCFQLLNNALDVNGINLDEMDSRRFVREFTENILARLNTPRLAVRYGNALSFALPLLHGEVNTVDLMLIEAVRIFFPKHYELVKNKPELFTRPHNDTVLMGNSSDDMKVRFKKELEDVGADLNVRDRSGIQDLLTELFPQLNGIYANYHYGEKSFNDWYKQKRICSHSYFNRYFTYTVIEGDLSDIAIKLLMDLVKTQSVEQISTEIEKLVIQTNPGTFLTKLAIIEDDLDWHTGQKLALAIAKCGRLFPRVESYFARYSSPSSLSALFIYKRFNLQTDGVVRFEFLKKLLAEANPYDLAYDIFSWFRNDGKDKESLLTDEQYKDGFLLLKNRAIKESIPKPFFDKFPDYAYYLCQTWALLNKEEFERYIKEFIEQDKSMTLNFIKAMVSTIISSASPLPFKADLDKKTYDHIKNLIDVDYLYTKAIDAFGDAIISDSIVFTFHNDDEKQTDENILKQFTYWYNKDKSERN